MRKRQIKKNLKKTGRYPGEPVFLEWLESLQLRARKVVCPFYGAARKLPK